MAVQTRIIKEDSLQKLYLKLAGAYKMFAPVSENGKVNFVYNPDHNKIKLDYVQSVKSVKNVVFPVIENLFRFKKDEQDSIQDVDIQNIPQLVLWGVHPCDASSFKILTSIFLKDKEDIFYKTRLENITIVSISCDKADDNCFCTSVGGNPASADDSDILLTRLASGDYFAEINTTKGLEIIKDYASLFAETDTPAESKLIAEVPVKFKVDNVYKKLPAMFYSDFWVNNSLCCIGCGVCAFVCPVCACFDIQDEIKGSDGVRIRCWDSCGFSLFTLHASGHNPRKYQSERWRQRIMHKFSYMPEQNLTKGCTGCGRCTRACPVNMNISDQLIMIDKMEIMENNS